MNSTDGTALAVAPSSPPAESAGGPESVQGMSGGFPTDVRRTSQDSPAGRRPEPDSRAALDVVERMNRILAAIASKRPVLDRDSSLVAREEDERPERTLALRANWNAPKRHVLGNPCRNGPWGKKLATLQARLGKGILIGLVGNRGVGKTQLAVELMKWVTSHGESALFRTAMELIMRFKDTYRQDSEEGELAVLRIHRRPALLVIDEIARRGQTEWENNMLFELLNQRYADMTDTILICNLGMAEFEASLGPSIVSRMQEGGGIIECNWPSFRSQTDLPNP